MTQRIDYQKQSPELFKKFIEFSMALRHSSIEESIHDLVNIRASQINGCAFCVDMHVKEATIHGERPLRLHHVAIWRESTLFIPRERAALAWTEILTKLPAQGVPDDVEAPPLRRQRYGWRAAAAPSSRTSICTPSWLCRRSTITVVASACRSTLVSDSCTTR